VLEDLNRLLFFLKLGSCSVAASCEHGNDHSVSIIDGELVAERSDCSRMTAPWSYFGQSTLMLCIWPVTDVRVSVKLHESLWSKATKRCFSVLTC
jgi:hypothetical protein